MHSTTIRAWSGARKDGVVGDVASGSVVYHHALTTTQSISIDYWPTDMADPLLPLPTAGQPSIANVHTIMNQRLPFLGFGLGGPVYFRPPTRTRSDDSETIKGIMSVHHCGRRNPAPTVGEVRVWAVERYMLSSRQPSLPKTTTTTTA